MRIRSDCAGVILESLIIVPLLLLLISASLQITRQFERKVDLWTLAQETVAYLETLPINMKEKGNLEVLRQWALKRVNQLDVAREPISIELNREPDKLHILVSAPEAPVLFIPFLGNDNTLSVERELPL